MAKNNKLSESVLNDIKKRYNKAVDEFAKEVAFQIEKTYEKVVEKFYEDYEPRFYERTYSTYLGSSAYDNIFDDGVQKQGDTYVSGIQVSGKNIPGNPYKTKNTEYVFNRTFYKGIHGMNRNDKIKINKHRNRNTYIKFTPVKNMVPPPVTIMDKEFKKLTKQSNLDKLFSESLQKNMGE